MTAFHDLTSAGRTGRLRRVAALALEHYDLTDYRFTVLADSFNTVYRVSCPRGTFVLRVGAEQRIHPAGAARAEAAWTGQLSASGLPVPRVIETTDGSASVTVSADGVPEPRECTLLTWTPGRALGRPIGIGDAHDLAALSAQLHTLSVDRPTPPPGVLSGRSALLFDVPNRLDEVGDRRKSVFTESLERAQKGIDELWSGAPRPPRLLHGDLTPNNVLRSRRRLVPVDFQDMTWGHEQQDLANTLFGIARDDDDGELARVFRSSYEARRPWPDLDEDLLADLVAARRLGMVNLALAMRRPGLDEFLERHAGKLADYLEARH